MMNSRTFATPSVGMIAGRAMTQFGAAVADIGRSIWRVLEAMGESRARGELQRMADTYARAQPELAAQLRSASRRNWFGEA